MASKVRIRSQSQIAGNIIRTLSNDTDITAFERGSDLVTWVEATSTAIYQAELTALKSLESIDVDSLTEQALDRKAQSMRMPDGEGGYGRKKAKRASGPVVIGSGFTKISSNFYAGKPEAYAGAETIYLQRADHFPPSGSVYIGRGTVDRFEGPIEYVSLVDNGSFWTMNLANPVTKSHIQSDMITLAQGGERPISAGTTIQIPASSENPAITFTITQDVVIHDGEDSVLTQAVCDQSGTQGNALAGAITEFSMPPFPGATVTNPTSFRNGRGIEDNESLRQRIKNYPSTLSRGVKTAIVDYLMGATDPESGRTISSVFVSDPLEPGDRGRIYIDDGTGLEPTFGNQPIEVLREEATGQETEFRLSQFPVTASAAMGENVAPFNLPQIMSLTVQIDNQFETYTINPSNYRSLSSSAAYEIVRDFNAQANMVGWRTINSGTGIVGIDLSGEGEIMRILPGELQRILGLPTTEIRPIFLYENSRILSFRGKTASLETVPRNQWSITSADLQNVPIIVDGVTQTISINNSDFAEFSSTIANATVSQWVSVLSRKVAGVRFFSQGQYIIAATWQENSANGSIVIPEMKADGTPSGWVGDDKMWSPSNLSDVGSQKDFKFNRFTGEIKLLKKPEPGSTIEAGTRNTRADIRSTRSPNGLYSLDPSIEIGNSKMIVGFDGQFEIRNPGFAPDLMVTATVSANRVRLTSNSANLFFGGDVLDYFYLIPDQTASSVIPDELEGFYRILSRGASLSDENVPYGGLTAHTNYFSGVPFSVKQGSDEVFVTLNNHGLRTGDLVTTSYSGAPVGGIPDSDLSRIDSLITVLSPNQFVFYAASSAVNDGNASLSFGSNVVLVDHVAHDFKDGAYLDISASSPIGGIPSVDFATTSDLEVVNSNSYKVRVLSSATSEDSGVVSVVYQADSWVEFQVSDDLLPYWTSIANTPYPWTPFMYYSFKSDGAIPQLVDFGSVGDQTIDQIVETINSQISLGKAEKIDPQSLVIRSNSYNNASTAILATLGNAALVFNKQVVLGIQPHVANSSSSEVAGGFPYISGVVIPSSNQDGYATRSYIVVDSEYTNLLDKDNGAIDSESVDYPMGFQHLWITGPLSGYGARVYNNETSAPYSGVMTLDDSVKPISNSSTDKLSYTNIGQRFSDIPLNNHDSFVVELDGSPADKTVSIAASKLAKIQDIDPVAGVGSGQVISFRLKDPDDGDLPFFDSSSVYRDFDFKDFKMLTKTVGIYREDSSDRAIVLRSYEFGSQSKMRMIIMLPSEADGELSVSHVNDFRDVGRTTIIVSLSGGPEITAATISSGRYRVHSTPDGDIFSWRITSGLLNENMDYTPGNVLNIGGVSPIAGSYLIDSSDYRELVSLTARTTGLSNVVEVDAPGHGLTDGDLVSVQTSTNIGGLSPANLSAQNVPIIVLDSNTFTYQALAVSSPSPVVSNVVVSDGSDTVTVTLNGHGFSTGDIVDVSALSPVGGISPTDLSVPGAVITVLDSNTFTYQALSSGDFNHTNVSASVINGSNTVSVSLPSHGLSTGDLISVSTSSPIGGISNVDLSVATVPVTVIDLNTFTYSALNSATSDETSSLDSIIGNSMSGSVNVSPNSVSGTLDSVYGGVVVVKSPGSGNVSTPQIFDSAQSSITTFEISGDSYQDIADAINEYNPDAPVATAEALGADTSITIDLPSYMVYANSPYSGTDMSGAFNAHAMESGLSAEAGIFQYDSSNPGLNNIKATVQSEDPLFPIASEIAGTDYNPIDEEVIIVPTNAKTLASWMSFRAMSSLQVMADAERIDGDKRVQISSKEDGSNGKVFVSGITANQLDSFVIGNSSFTNNSIRTSILRSAARSMKREQLVQVQNSISSEIRRAYRNTPTGPSLTSANPNSEYYFRNTNSIKYIRTGANTARIIFLRNGLGDLQVEPLAEDNEITLTDLGNGLVSVVSSQAGGASGTGILSARVGDMMYIHPDSPFPDQNKSKRTPMVTPGLSPEYVGFPVVNVVNQNEVTIIAPNFVFGTTTLTSSYDLLFLPAVWNEKNIRTNHFEGNKYDFVRNSANYIVKRLGQGMVSVYVQNESSEDLDDMLLDMMSVSSDDWAVFGDDFSPLNRGTYKIVAHNGRNQIVVYNPNGGEDEVFHSVSSFGGMGNDIWSGGQLADGVGRSLRIISGDSVRIGDKLRISSPLDMSQWFNDSFFGSHTILGIGLQAVDYSSFPLPHTSSSGIYDLNYITPYVEIELTNAPLAVTDSSGNPVDSFFIGGNTPSIGFTEGSPYFTFKYLSGVANSSSNVERSDIFLMPAFNASKISSSFGSKVIAWNKAGFDQVVKSGIDGYKIYTGLIQEAHRIVDGLPTNQVNYPGVKAFGATLEVQTSLYKTISFLLRVRPTDGVTLSSISEIIKSTVANYVNTLGPGNAVVISEVIKVVKTLPGVYSVEVPSTIPMYDQDRIVVSDIEKAYVLNTDTDITFG